MKYGDQLRKIRRFLRDPSGKIWGTDYLRTAFNGVQREIQHKTGFLENIATVGIPSYYQHAYLYEWEWRFLPTDQGWFYQALYYFQQGGYAFCAKWEMQQEWGGSGVDGEDGAQFTQPWEAWMDTPADTIKNKLPSDFHSAKLVAYDYIPLDPIDRRTITDTDSDWRSRSGIPYAWYRDNELEDDFVLYPRPSSVVWNDVSEQSNPDYFYSFDWEESNAHIAGTGRKYARSNDTLSYLFIWENVNVGTLDDELVTNGDFTATAGWTLGSGMSAGSGVISVSGAQALASDLTQALTLRIGVIYEVSYEIKNYVAGFVRPFLGDPFGRLSFGDGVKTEPIRFSGTDQDITLTVTDDFVGDLDNVSVKANVLSTPGLESDYGMRGMYLFERSFSQSGQYGTVLYLTDETPVPFGTFAKRSATIFNQEYGLTVNCVDATDNILLMYKAMATDIQDVTDESDYPELIQKYIECGTLEQAYGANTDGRIRSLQEYWDYRYQMGLRMIKRFMSNRKQDRDYRFVTSTQPTYRRFRHARLPDSYPDR